MTVSVSLFAERINDTRKNKTFTIVLKHCLYCVDVVPVRFHRLLFGFQATFGSQPFFGFKGRDFLQEEQSNK